MSCSARSSVTATPQVFPARAMQVVAAAAATAGGSDARLRRVLAQVHGDALLALLVRAVQRCVRGGDALLRQRHRTQDLQRTRGTAAQSRTELPCTCSRLGVGTQHVSHKHALAQTFKKLCN